MKKILSLLLAVLLLFTAIPISTYASTVATPETDAGTTTTPTILGTHVAGYAGDTVTVDIRLSNNPGIVSIKVGVGYDAEVLELVSIGEQDFSGVSFGPLTNNPIAVNWINTISANNTTNGVVALLTFKVKENAPVGSTAITLSYYHKDVYDYDWNEIAFAIENGSVTVNQHVTGISLNTDTLAIKNGETATLTATVEPENAYNKAIIWESSDPAVATVDENGVVTGIKKGTATITATTEDGGFNATCTVDVACAHRNVTVHEAEASTCIRYGHTAYTACNDCGEIINGSNTQLPLGDHTGGNATCVTLAICDVCYNPYGSYAPHEHSDAWSSNDDQHWHECVCGDKAAVGDHIADAGTVTKKATCTATGTKVYKCTVCDKVIKTETIAKAAHSYNAATCTEPKTCKNCGVTSGKALGHDYDAGKVTKKATCKATGVKTYTCEDCGATKTEPIAKAAHSYNAATCTEPKTCKNCGVTSGKALGHTYSNACDEACNVCGATRSVPAHKYDSGKVTKATTCKATGVKTYTCEDCGATKTSTIAKLTTHTYKTTTTKASTSKNGSIVKECTVCGKVASSTTIKYAKTFTLSTTTYTYDGKVKTPSVTVKDAAGNVLKKDTDYKVTYASGRKNAGTYKVTVTMMGNYTGTKTLTFKINPAKLSSFKLSATSYTYDGKVKTPTVTVKNASGTTLTKNTHYTVTYASGRKNVGTYKVTIKGKGNYTGTKTLTFKINPAKTTVSTVTPASKSLKVSITKKTTQVTGYQIQYSTSNSFTSATTKTLTKNTTTSTTLTGLKAKTTYYVRVRTYKTVNGVKYYSGWSTAKSAKTK